MKNHKLSPKLQFEEDERAQKRFKAQKNLEDTLSRFIAVKRITVRCDGTRRVGDLIVATWIVGDDFDMNVDELGNLFVRGLFHRKISVANLSSEEARKAADYIQSMIDETLKSGS